VAIGWRSFDLNQNIRPNHPFGGFSIVGRDVANKLAHTDINKASPAPIKLPENTALAATNA
jgi:hypothetical protein